ncbi:MAG: hypothetical protein ACO3SO_04430 [Luteolibacter sp.]
MSEYKPDSPDKQLDLSQAMLVFLDTMIVVRDHSSIRLGLFSS